MGRQYLETSDTDVRTVRSCLLVVLPVLVASLVASSCSSAVAPSSTPSPAGDWGAPEAAVEQTSFLSGGASSGGSSFARSERKPPPCPFLPAVADAGTTGAVALAVVPQATGLLHWVSICLGGTDPALLDVAMLAPDGRSIELRPASNDRSQPRSFTIEHWVAPGYSSGTYLVEARLAGRVVAVAELVVREPSKPIVRVRPPSNGKPGDDFVLDLAGYAPGHRPVIDVYRAGSSGIDFFFVESIEAPVADALGHAYLPFDTEAGGDLPGVYCFVVRGDDPACLAAVLKLS